MSIKDHGGQFGGGIGLKSDPKKELLVSATPYGRETYTTGTENNIFAVSDKYVAYRKDHVNTSTVVVVNRSDRSIVLTFTIPGGFYAYTRSYLPTAAFAGDWLYFTGIYNTSYYAYGISVILGSSSLKTIPGAAFRFESMLHCSDGHVYGVSYNQLMKLDNAGNLIYLKSFSESSGGDKVFGIFNGELMIGLNGTGMLMRFNPDTGSKISTHSNLITGDPRQLFQIGDRYYVRGTDLVLRRFNLTFSLNDLSMSNVYSAYMLDSQTIFATMRDASSNPAGASTYDPNFVVKQQSVSGFNILSNIFNEKSGSHFDVVHGYGGTNEPTVENSLVRVYYK